MMVPRDWEAIEREYRAGQLSIREIARQHGVSDAAIHKRAAARGWQRNMAEAVRNAVEATLVSTQVSSANSREPVDISESAARGVEVVLQHREMLTRLRRIFTQTAEQLQSHLSRQSGEPAGEDVPIFQAKGDGVASLITSLSSAAARIIPLERQAFALDPRPGERPADDYSSLTDDEVDARLRRLVASVSSR